MIKYKSSFIITLLLWSAMGPYVFPQIGLRLEHIVMYVLLIAIAFKSQLRVFLPKDRTILALVAMFVSMLVVFIFVTLFSDYSPSFRKVIADAENYIQPIVLIMIAYHCIKKMHVNELLYIFDDVTRTMTIVLSVNALIAISSIFFGTWIFEYFNVGGEYEGGGIVSVASAAATQGRYSGVFNQPFEAGVAYGSCLLLIVTNKLLRQNQFHLRPVSKFHNVGILLVLTGGLLSVSKVFFPMSVVVCMYFLLLNNKRFLKVLISQKTMKTFMLFLIPAVGAVIYLFNYWSGVDYLLRLVNFFGKDVDIVELFTAGRFASSATGMSVVSDRLVDTNLLVGYGLGSIQAPDSAYLEVLYFGGVLGLLCYFLILFALAFMAVKHNRRHPVIARYLLSLTLFIALASIGAPIFGINRSNFFVIIPLVLVIRILSLAKNKQVTIRLSSENILIANK